MRIGLSYIKKAKYRVSLIYYYGFDIDQCATKIRKRDRNRQLTRLKIRMNIDTKTGRKR